MTIEEKIVKLQTYCAERDCSNCVFESERDCWFRNMDDKHIDKCYEKITEQPCESNTVNHPNHYQGANECIDVMVAMFGKEAVKHFCMCNAYKYRFRATMKNGEEDIKKAEFYETYLIKLGGVDNV